MRRAKPQTTLGKIEGRGRVRRRMSRANNLGKKPHVKILLKMGGDGWRWSKQMMRPLVEHNPDV